MKRIIWSSRNDKLSLRVKMTDILIVLPALEEFVTGSNELILARSVQSLAGNWWRNWRDELLLLIIFIFLVEACLTYNCS